MHFRCFCQLCIYRALSCFDAQALYFVHSGLPTLSNNYPTAGNFSCTGVALRAFFVFLQTAFTVPWVIFDAQAQYFVSSGLATVFNNYQTVGNC